MYHYAYFLAIHDPLFFTTTNISYIYIFIKYCITSAHNFVCFCIYIYHCIKQFVKVCGNFLFIRTIRNDVTLFNGQWKGLFVIRMKIYFPITLTACFTLPSESINYTYITCSQILFIV